MGRHAIRRNQIGLGVHREPPAQKLAERLAMALLPRLPKPGTALPVLKIIARLWRFGAALVPDRIVQRVTGNLVAAFHHGEGKPLACWPRFVPGMRIRPSGDARRKRGASGVLSGMWAECGSYLFSTSGARTPVTTQRFGGALGLVVSYCRNSPAIFTSMCGAIPSKWTRACTGSRWY